VGSSQNGAVGLNWVVVGGVAAGGGRGHGFVGGGAQDGCPARRLAGRCDCHHPHAVGSGFAGLWGRTVAWVMFCSVFAHFYLFIYLLF
jgi:hypothetical protein